MYVMRGSSYPIGASYSPEGVNFCVFSKSASKVELLFFEDVEDIKPYHIITLDPRRNKTYHYWHVFVPNIPIGQIYAYRVYGPFQPEKGFRFDHNKILLDPYGKAVAIPKGYCREMAIMPGDNCKYAMKSVVACPSKYDWQGDTPLKQPFARTIIYELHVKGFTANPNSGVPESKRGTYAGLIHKIPYLKELGITAVELMPVFHFDEYDAPQGLKNYWGYAPISFFAPHPFYSSDKSPLAVLDEFRDMVKALHHAGIEVILDVVYNHTAEGNEFGPTLSFKGFQNDAYYILNEDKSTYGNYTGCGNTLDASNPFVKRMIIDSLHYWVKEMHIDGFRFDLASILTRDNKGRPMANPPVLWDIETDPVLSGVKLIAEAWDAGGLYQVGSFIGDSWKEWNGRFRDDVRKFLRADNGSVISFASRVLGSPDIYGYKEREPEQSINFVTCHDGFTLNDLVSYNEKHNLANREDNRDGTDANYSFNYGVEGETDDPNIEQIRIQQIKNFHTINILSIGTPMILMGDEFRRTQQGNNNAYIHDNEISWMDWSLYEKNYGLVRFVQHLNSGRLKRDVSVDDPGLSLNQMLSHSKIVWHGVKIYEPDWSYYSHSIAVTIVSLTGRLIFHMIANAYWEDLIFEIPNASEFNGKQWLLWIDTSLNPPHDISLWHDAKPFNGKKYKVKARSIVILLSFKKEGEDKKLFNK